MSDPTPRNRARFIILAAGGLYEEADVDAVCRRHAIEGEALKMELWRVLEDAARQWLDARRLDESRITLGRLRQELLLGLRLGDQRERHVPGEGGLEGDRATVNLSRHHLSSLRQAEHALAQSDGPRHFSLEDCVEAVRQLKAVYETAAERCRANGRGEQAEPLEAWRSTLRDFYVRRLGREWSSESEPAGEAFLIDCQAPLSRHVATADGDETLIAAQ